MRLWRITPSARPDDPRWLGGPEWRELVVRAETAAEARVVAARMEAANRRFDPGADVAGAASMGYPSALDDETLYHVVELPGGDPAFPADGPAEVLVAERA